MTLNLSCLFGNSFFITIVITLLISGLILYYCNSRFTSIERGLHRQNQILADFITNVQGQLQYEKNKEDLTLSSHPVNKLASKEAINAVEHMNTDESSYSSNIKSIDKIEISDDETNNSDLNEDSDSDDSESDDDTQDSENENDDDINDKTIKIFQNNESQLKDLLNSESIKVITMPTTTISLNDIKDLINSEQNIDENPQITEINDINDTNNNIKLINTSIDMNEPVEVNEHVEANEPVEVIEPVEVNEPVEVIEPVEANVPAEVNEIEEIKDLEELSSEDDYTDDDNEDNEEIQSTSNKKDAFKILNMTTSNNNQAVPSEFHLKKMNVVALREMIVERGLLSENSAKKMKKNNLIELLTK